MAGLSDFFVDLFIFCFLVTQVGPAIQEASHLQECLAVQLIHMIR